MTVAASTANVLVKAKRVKELAFLAGQREHRNEGEQDDRHREEHGPPDQSRGVPNGLPDSAAVAGVDSALLDESERVLRDDDARIHEHANRDGDAGEAHDVGGDPGVVHAQERHQDGERQRKGDDQDRPEVHQEDDVRQRHERDLLDQRRAQRADRLLDQVRAVVERHDRDARREARRNLRDARFHGVDDVLRVDAGSCDDDAADGFLRPFHERGDPERVADLDVRHLLDVDRDAVRAADDDPLDVVDGRDQPDASHDQPGAVRLEHVAADIQVAGADGRHDRAERQVVGPEAIRIDIHLVLLDMAADGGHFRDARHGIELVADEPVLQRAELAE